MDTSELRAVLERSGLSPYQADAYTTVLELGSASASEIAAASDVPQPRVYDVLRSLDERGYVTVYQRDRLFARAVDPAEALSELRTTIERYETAVDEIESRYRAPEVGAGEVSLVRRFRTVLDHAREAVEAADDHIQLAATPERFDALRPLLAGAHDRDVHVQVSLHCPEGVDRPADATFEGVCTEVRRRDLPGPFLLLVDRQRACYATHGLRSRECGAERAEGTGSDERSRREYGVIVDDYTTAYVFHWYYLTRLWEVYEPTYTDRDDRPPYAFVEITDCIRGVEPALDDGATVVGRVDGEFTATGRACRLSGRFVGVEYTGARPDEGPASLLKLAAEARIVFETDDDVYTVGGRGAYDEDVAGTRFTVERVDRPDDADTDASADRT